MPSLSKRRGSTCAIELEGKHAKLILCTRLEKESAPQRGGDMENIGRFWFHSLRRSVGRPWKGGAMLPVAGRLAPEYMELNGPPLKRADARKRWEAYPIGIPPSDDNAAAPILPASTRRFPRQASLKNAFCCGAGREKRGVPFLKWLWQSEM